MELAEEDRREAALWAIFSEMEDAQKIINGESITQKNLNTDLNLVDLEYNRENTEVQPTSSKNMEAE